MKNKIPAVFLSLCLLCSFPCALPAGAAAFAAAGVTVAVQDGYSCDYGVDIPFTRSPRTQDYTFALYEGPAAAGAPEVTAKVTVTPASQVVIHLPLRYDPAGPDTWTLAVTVHVAPGRAGLDREAAAVKTFETAPSCGCPAGTAGAYYAGDGSAQSPFRVATPGQLQHMNAHLSSQFIQTQDIALTGTFIPIGSAEKAFSGVYDGGGHVISNLNTGPVTGSDRSMTASGLFGETGKVTIQNLGIEDYSVKGELAAPLIGLCSGPATITRCYTRNGSAMGGSSTKGAMPSAMVSYLHASASASLRMTDCYAVGGAVTSYSAAGGLLGFGQSGTPAVFTNCFTILSSISADESSGNYGSGGIAGVAYSSTFRPTNCWFLSGTPAYAVGAYRSVSAAGPSTTPSGTEGTALGDFNGLQTLGLPSDVWEIKSDTVNGRGNIAYPHLRVFGEP